LVTVSVRDLEESVLKLERVWAMQIRWALEKLWVRKILLGKAD
jgi:hypothetical protein